MYRLLHVGVALLDVLLNGPFEHLLVADGAPLLHRVGQGGVGGGGGGGGVHSRPEASRGRGA